MFVVMPWSNLLDLPDYSKAMVVANYPRRREENRLPQARKHRIHRNFDDPRIWLSDDQEFPLCLNLC
jgi:hypothetical protein